MEAAGQIQSLLDNRHEEINAYGNPDLDLDRIRRCPEERLDPQVLLDPLEEQLYLPTRAINIRDCFGRDKEIVRKNHQAFVSFGVVIAHPTKWIWISLAGFVANEHNRLIGLHPVGFVHGSRVDATKPGIAFALDNEERGQLIDLVKSLEVEVSAIHCIDRFGFERDSIHHIDIVNAAGSHENKGWNRSLHVEQSVNLDGCFLFPKRRPRERGKAKIDDR